MQAGCSGEGVFPENGFESLPNGMTAIHSVTEQKVILMRCETPYRLRRREVEVQKEVILASSPQLTF